MAITFLYLSKVSKHKKVKDSKTEIRQLVLPDDTNPLGYLRGGVLMEWIDIASEIVDKVSLTKPIKLGDIVTSPWLYSLKL